MSLGAKIFQTPGAHARGPKPVWRGLLALTALVVLAHLVVLGRLPVGIETAATPLGGHFSTRTIVLAPPAPPAKVPAAAAEAARTTGELPLPKPAAGVKPVAQAPVVAPKQHIASAKPVRHRAQPPPASASKLAVVPAASASEASEIVAAEPALAGLAAPAAQAAAAPGDEGAAARPAPAVPAAPAPDSATTAAAPPGAVEDAANLASASASGPGAGAGLDAAGPAPGATAPAGPVEHLGAGTQALRIPGSVRLGFEVSGQQGAAPMRGVFGELEWLHNGSAYDARLALTLLFKTLRSQRSTGRIGPGGLAPERFSDTRRSEVAAHFVRERGLVVFSSNAPPVALLPGAQDRLSVILQLGALLAGDAARFAPGSAITVQTVGPRDADVWRFDVEGDEALSLPVGEHVVARKLSRAPRREFDDRIELWFAPGLGWLPVRIRITQARGDFADFQLRSVTPLGPPG